MSLPDGIAGVAYHNIVMKNNAWRNISQRLN